TTEMGVAEAAADRRGGGIIGQAEAGRIEIRDHGRGRRTTQGPCRCGRSGERKKQPQNHPTPHFTPPLSMPPLLHWSAAIMRTAGVSVPKSAVVMTVSMDIRRSMVRPGSRGDSCWDVDHGVKGSRYAAAKPPLTPWSTSKILSSTRSRPCSRPQGVHSQPVKNLCVEELNRHQAEPSILQVH